MSSSTRFTAAHKIVPCRFYSQGGCRFGDKCKYSHGTDAQSISKRDSSLGATSSTPSHSRETYDARPGPKRGETPCRAWKAGTCIKGSKCQFRHITEEPAELAPHQQGHSASSRPMSPVAEEDATTSPDVTTSRAKRNRRREVDVEAAARERVDAIVREEAAKKINQVGYVRRKVADEAAVRERAEAIVKEEAAKTISQAVFGSIVTYSAGLDVSKLITGFETCTIRFANLPPDVKEEDIHTLLRDQGIDVDSLHLVLKKGADCTPEAHIVTDIANGQVLVLCLDGIEFRDEPLVVEMSAANSLDGMDATAGQGSDVLTISWRAPSARYVAEFADIPAAKVKVAELNRSVYSGRRVRVEMNSQPPGYFIPNLRLNAIKINNLPPDVTDQDVIRFTKSQSAKRLRIKGTLTGAYTVEQVARLVRSDIQQAVPEGFLRFDDPPSTCNLDGTVSARARFLSWDEAHIAYTRLSGQRYCQQAIWLRLPNPMHYTLVIPIEQYRAQKTQWDSLLESTKDQQACILHVHETGHVVRVQLSGSIKEATGAMKVRVENLARGEKVEGWHRLLGLPRNPFVHRVYSETGAYLRAELQRQSLKVYGAPKAVDQAREMIKNELERLASLDYTLTLARGSVGFFVREGIQRLQETLGEDNVRFATSSRQITVSGGEEARHALDRLIELSLNGKSTLPGTQRGNQTCPICYDDISSPHQLGCNHTYCVACLRHYISSALESDQLPLLCLGSEAQCHVPIPIPTIQHFVPPATFNQLLEAAFDVHIAKHPEEFKHCKTPDCTQIYRAVKAKATPQTLHCPSCFSAVCNACHDDAHDGLTCAQSRDIRHPFEQARMDAWIASQEGRVKKCPQCTVPIEKIEGCNHLTCRCGAHICWHCLGVYTDRTIYAHMNEAHGTIYSREAEEQERQAVENHRQQQEVEEQGAQVAEQQEANWERQVAEWRRQQEAEEAERGHTELRQQRELEWEARAAEWRQHQEAQEQERRLAEQRRQRELEWEARAAEWRRHQEAQEQERRRVEQQRQQQETAERERQVAEQRRKRETEEQERRRVEQQRQQQETAERERQVAEQRRKREAEEQERRRAEQRLQRQVEERARRAAEERRQRQVERQRQQAEAAGGERPRTDDRHRRAEEWDRRLREQRHQVEERLRAEEDSPGCGCGCAIM